MVLATKLKNKYSALNEDAKKRKKKGGYSYDGTNEKLRLMRKGPVKAVSTPTAETTDANTSAADDLSTLVKDISSVVPVSKIDTMQTRNPVGQSFLESTRRDEAETEEETKLVEEVERIRDRVNSDRDLRETMRPKPGPSDLRNATLNRDTDARELLQPKAGPSDLRYSKLQPEKDLRDIMKSKPKPKDESVTSALAALSAYESSSSEEEQVQPTENDSTPKRHRPHSKIDLRRKLDGEPDFSDQRKHPTQLSKTDIRRKLTGAQRILYRDPVPRKMAPNCSEEHRHLPPPPPPTRNWWDDPEEDENEKFSEDDISTDKCEGNDSSQ